MELHTRPRGQQRARRAGGCTWRVPRGAGSLVPRALAPRFWSGFRWPPPSVAATACPCVCAPRPRASGQGGSDSFLREARGTPGCAWSTSHAVLVRGAHV
jgi:hypothetical protein